MANLPKGIKQGILSFPTTPDAKQTAERLLEEDRQQHHCFWHRVGFHNHLSHHILAAYDLGAPAGLLRSIYDVEQKGLSPIDVVDRVTGEVEKQSITITDNNWTEYLGQAKFYAVYMDFFEQKIKSMGTPQVLETYVLSPSANAEPVYMLLRFVGGALHPMIQLGYAVEFGSDAMAAQALAQSAVHSAFVPQIFDLGTLGNHVRANGVQESKDPSHRQPSKGHSLLSIFTEVYDSDILHPVMPYDPDALLTKRREDALKDGRPEEILRLCNLWQVDVSRGQEELDEKVEELVFLVTMLLVGSGKSGRKPRLDFFIMHMLTASLFIPSLIKTIPSIESKAMLLRATLPVMLLYLIIRGRPRIDPELMMSYTAIPRPSVNTDKAKPDPSAVGDPTNNAYVNPWPAIIASVVHAPDAHTVKSIRALYYASQKYGTIPPGGVIGAFQPDGSETHKGMAKVDGTIFIRAAGVVMDTLGWVSHGQKEGNWDRSAMGWNDAWKNEVQV